MSRKIAVKQIRSVIGRPEKQKRTMKALGLRKMNATAIHADTPVIRGMVAKVQHLVEVRELNDE